MGQGQPANSEGAAKKVCGGWEIFRNSPYFKRIENFIKPGSSLMLKISHKTSKSHLYKLKSQLG